jgi:hypothetical protein
MVTTFALAGGAWIFAIFIVVMLIGVIFGLFSRTGSAINQRPYGNPYDSATQARGESTLGNDRAAADRLTKRKTQT